jgi:hypothetical protein
MLRPSRPTDIWHPRTATVQLTVNMDHGLQNRFAYENRYPLVKPVETGLPEKNR